MKMGVMGEAFAGLLLFAGELRVDLHEAAVGEAVGGGTRITLGRTVAVGMTITVVHGITASVWHSGEE